MRLANFVKIVDLTIRLFYCSCSGAVNRDITLAYGHKASDYFAAGKVYAATIDDRMFRI